MPATRTHERSTASGHERPAAGRRSTLRSTARAWAVVLASLLAIAAAPAIASATTETLAGSGSTGYSPDSMSDQFTVEATSVDGVASGTLTTAGKVSGDVDGTFAGFEGGVTCVTVEGDRAVVGAVGTVTLFEIGRPGSTLLPGTYGQLLSVELGSFRDPNLEEPTFYSFRFGTLGEHDEGVVGMTAPDCGDAAVPSTWMLPTNGGAFTLTPAPSLSGGSAPAPGGEILPVGEESLPAGGGSSSTSMRTGAPSGTLAPGAPLPTGGTGIAGFVARRLAARITSVKVSRGQAKIAFASAGGAGKVAFVCRLDGRPMRGCASPTRLRLKPGKHRFSVSAVGGGAERSALASTSISVG
jgi:hypothetical protein